MRVNRIVIASAAVVALQMVAVIPLLPRAPSGSLGYTMPANPVDGALAQQLKALMENSGGTIDALVILRNGQVLFEGGAIARPMNVASVRKGVLGMLFGIAAARGLVDLEATLEDLDIDESQTPLTTLEKKATVLDLLAARSGVYLPGDAEGDLSASLLPKRGSLAPGDAFAYSNWGFNALGTIFEQETCLTLGQAFADWIAIPTGMQDFAPSHIFKDRDAGPSDHPAYRVMLSARDLARFGALITNDGQYHGREVIPQAWIQRSATPLSNVGPPLTGAPFESYGLSWWLDPVKGDMVAAGSGGQFLFVGRWDGLTVAILNDTGTTVARHLWHKLKGRSGSGATLLTVIGLLR